MLLLEVVIPTRNRLKKLITMLDSLPDDPKNFKMDVTVVMDGGDLDITSFKIISALLNETAALIARGVDNVVKIDGHHGSVYCRNEVISKSSADMILYGTDDIEFKPGSVEIAVDTFLKKFPDLDGIVGFHQINARRYSPAGVAIVGSKFIDRYPGRKLFFPGYWLFACQEIARAGEILDKIYVEKRAGLIHHTGNLDKNLLDQTHIDGRIRRNKDMQLSEYRREQGLTWGIN